MLELYHNNMSVCAQKVRLVLAEKGLSAVEHHLNLRAGDQQKPEYVKLNPKAYVPTLVHNGNVITESSVICEFLDEVFPDPALRPSNSGQRAIMRTWTRRPDAGIHDACVIMSNAIAFRHQWLARPADELERTIREMPDRGRRALRRELLTLGAEGQSFKKAVWAYDTLLEDMEVTLQERTWLVGAEYTLADVALIPYINRLAALKLQGMWDRRPGIADWYARIKARPNYVNAIEDYNDAAYLALMAEEGTKHTQIVESALNEG